MRSLSFFLSLFLSFVLSVLFSKAKRYPVAVKRRESEERKASFLLPPVRNRTVSVSGALSLLAPAAAAFTELPTRIKEENAEM